MEKNLKLLDKARINYSSLIVQVGIQYLSAFPDADPEQFVESFVPSNREILAVLMSERAKLKNKKLLGEMKKRRAISRLKKVQLKI